MKKTHVYVYVQGGQHGGKNPKCFFKTYQVSDGHYCHWLIIGTTF